MSNAMAEADRRVSLAHARKLIRQLYDQRPAYCDVEFHCVNDIAGERAVVLHAHRAILAAKCRCVSPTSQSSADPPGRSEFINKSSCLCVVVRRKHQQWGPACDTFLERPGLDSNTRRH
jgi:hypothetical protein